MIRKIIISPKFNVKEIVHDAIDRKWFTFQEQVFNLGYEILAYMQNYISVNTKRRGSTGRLANSMTIEVLSVPGKGQVFWGIGNIEKLQQLVPYWYVVNYGKMITGQPYIPYHGALIPGSFLGNPPYSELSGTGQEQFTVNDGSNFFMRPKKPIRPMNYIQSTRHQLDMRLRVILAGLKGGK